LYSSTVDTQYSITDTQEMKEWEKRPGKVTFDFVISGFVLDI
jgi:hypothetical protein